MVFLLLLCNFCEEDGPTVLLTTYPDSSIELLKNKERPINERLRNLPPLGLSLATWNPSCIECRSLSDTSPFIVSSPNDWQEFKEKNPSYFVTSRLPPGRSKV